MPDKGKKAPFTVFCTVLPRLVPVWGLSRRRVAGVGLDRPICLAFGGLGP